jgi:hypothetical protein
MNLKGKIVGVEKRIAKFPNVCAIYDITDFTDMIVVAKFKNRIQLSNFIKKELPAPATPATTASTATAGATAQTRVGPTKGTEPETAM